MNAPARIVARATRETLVNIGQLDAAEVRALDAAARAGSIARWRGYWYPVPGGHRAVEAMLGADRRPSERRVRLT